MAKFHYLDFSKFQPERKERGNKVRKERPFGKRFLVSLFKYFENTCRLKVLGKYVL